MKLTELRNQIDEALKLHDDYDVKIVLEDVTDIEDIGIDPGRFNFNIYVEDKSFSCYDYHIEEDEDMEHCGICSVYYSTDKECPSCELKELKK